MASSSPQTQAATASGDLLALVSSPTSSAVVYPTDDTILSVLQARFRNDLPYTRIGATHLVIVNPYKTLGCSSEASAREYEEKEYKDTSGADRNGVGDKLQPHLYDIACKMYLLMRRKREAQAVVARCVHSVSTFREQ